MGGMKAPEIFSCVVLPVSKQEVLQVVAKIGSQRIGMRKATFATIIMGKILRIGTERATMTSKIRKVGKTKRIQSTIMIGKEMIGRIRTGKRRIGVMRIQKLGV